MTNRVRFKDGGVIKKSAHSNKLQNASKSSKSKKTSKTHSREISKDSNIAKKIDDFNPASIH